MRYTFDIYDLKTNKHVDTITNHSIEKYINDNSINYDADDHAFEINFWDICYIIAHDNILHDSLRLDDADAWESYQTRMERGIWASGPHTGTVDVPEPDRPDLPEHVIKKFEGAQVATENRSKDQVEMQSFRIGELNPTMAKKGTGRSIIDAEIRKQKILEMREEIKIETLPSNFKKATDPSHYKNYIREYQWLETEQDISNDFEEAVLMQIRKYLARNGKKDNTLQELLKAKFYLDFLCARLIEEKSFIRISQVRNILKEYENI